MKLSAKKALVTAAACTILVGVLAVPALAHHGGGHHGRRAAASTAYPVCTVENCGLAYRHEHDGVTYCGHTVGDGHSWCADGTGRRHGRCH